MVASLILISVLIASSAESAISGDISVRLRPLRETFSVSGRDLVFRSVPSDGEARVVVRGKPAFDRLTVRYQQGAWKITDTTSSEKEIAVAQGRKLELRGADIRIDLRPAPAHLQFVVAKSTRSNGGPLSLVGFLSIEDYLEGVVPSEVPRDWPFEALKAQAVAARSFTLATIRDRARSNPDWLLEANVTDQVFDLSRTHSRTSDAVRATAGEILSNSGANAALVNYHSDCGGRTDEPTAIWGAGLKTGTAVDKGCSISSRNTWTYTVTRDLLAQKLSGRGLLPSGFKLAGVSVTKRSEGGRAITVGVRSLDGRQIDIPGQRLRETLGYSAFKSTLFEVKAKPQPDEAELEFNGRGFGHGAGLCQWGARGLALSGRDYRQILSHYYPRLRLISQPASSHSVATR